MAPTLIVRLFETVQTFLRRARNLLRTPLFDLRCQPCGVPFEFLARAFSYCTTFLGLCVRVTNGTCQRPSHSCQLPTLAVDFVI